MVDNNIIEWVSLAKKAKMVTAIVYDQFLIGCCGYSIIVVDINNPNYTEIGFNIMTASLAIKDGMPEIPIISENEYYSIFSMWGSAMSYSMAPYIEYCNMEQDARFIGIVNGKTKEGSSMYVIGDTVLSLYSSLLPINKGDSVTLRVYHISNDCDLIQFIIYKKKDKFIINQYMRILRL